VTIVCPCSKYRVIKFENFVEGYHLRGSESAVVQLECEVAPYASVHDAVTCL